MCSVGDVGCTLSNLDGMHDGKLIQNQIVRGYWTTEKPVNPVEKSKMIEFDYSGSGNELAELNSMYFTVAAKITKANGGDIDAGSKVATINNLLNAMWNQIDIFWNDERVTSPVIQHASRANIETILSYNADSLDTKLSAQLFYKDTAGQMDNADPNPTAGSAVNEGLKKRYQFSKESKMMQLMGRLHADPFLQDKPLIPGVRMRIRLHRNSDEYLLMSSEADAAYKLEIMDITLNLRKLVLSSSAYTKLMSRDVIYTFPRIETKEYLQSRGQKNFYMPNVATGILPTRIVLLLISSDAGNGSYKLNPFNHQHYNLTSVAVTVNGALLGGRPLELDCEQNRDLEGYFSLIAATGKISDNRGCYIPREDYKGGYMLLAFDLTPTQCGESVYSDPSNAGDAHINLTFKENLPVAIKGIVYLEYEGKIVINKAKQVITYFNT